MKRLTVTQLNARPFAVKVNPHTNVLAGDAVYLVPITPTAPQAAYGSPEVTVVQAWAAGVITVRLADGSELTTSGENVRHRRPDRRERDAKVRLLPGRIPPPSTHLPVSSSTCSATWRQAHD